MLLSSPPAVLSHHSSKEVLQVRPCPASAQPLQVCLSQALSPRGLPSPSPCWLLEPLPFAGHSASSSGESPYAVPPRPSLLNSPLLKRPLKLHPHPRPHPVLPLLLYPSCLAHSLTFHLCISPDRMRPPVLNPST